MSKRIKDWNTLFELVDSGAVYLRLRANAFNQFTNVYVDFYFFDGSIMSHSTFKTFAKRLDKYSMGTMEPYKYIEAHYEAEFSTEEFYPNEIKICKENAIKMLFDSPEKEPVASNIENTK